VQADPGCPGPAGSGLCRVRRAGCRLRQAGRRAGGTRGADPGQRRPQPRTPARGGRRCPAPATLGRDVNTLSGGERRRVALCRLLLSGPGHADPGRADQPPRCRERRLARALPAGVPGTVVAVTHDRYFLDNVAGWILELDRGQGIPWEGNYSSWLEQKEKRLAQSRRSTSRTARKELKRNWSGCACQPQGPRGQEQGPHEALRGAFGQRLPARDEDQGHSHPAGTRAGRPGRRGREPDVKGFGDQLLIEDLNFDLPRGGIVGVIGPNGAGKTTLFR
jgi:energy-dependent translational throttle protein EttA